MNSWLEKMRKDDYLRAVGSCYVRYDMLISFDDATIERKGGEGSVLNEKAVELLADNDNMTFLESMVERVKKDIPLKSIDDYDGIFKRLKTINMRTRVLFPMEEHPRVDALNRGQKELDAGILKKYANRIKKESLQKLIDENERLRQENERLEHEKKQLELQNQGIPVAEEVGSPTSTPANSKYRNTPTRGRTESATCSSSGKSSKSTRRGRSSR